MSATTASSAPPALGSGPSLSPATPASASSAPTPADAAPTAAPSAAAVPPAWPELFRDVPRTHFVGVELLRYLASLNSYGGAFDPDRSAAADVEQLTAALASQVVFTDVNQQGRVTKLSRDEIAKQLKARDGQAFRGLMHLGCIAEDELRYPRPTTLKAVTTNSGYVLELSTWYRLSFGAFNSDAKLERIEYLKLEGH